jgi:hypothetical protein
VKLETEVVKMLFSRIHMRPFENFADSSLFTPSHGGTSLARDALLTTLHPLLENVLQTIDHFEISCLGAPFSWLEKPRNRMGRDLYCIKNVLMGFHRSTFSKLNTEFNSDLAPSDFWAFPIMKR